MEDDRAQRILNTLRAKDCLLRDLHVQFAAKDAEIANLKRILGNVMYVYAPYQHSSLPGVKKVWAEARAAVGDA